MNPLPVSLPFTDRAEAGRRLAERVRAFAVADPIVVALPRGGVPVGAELARSLRAPLDVIVVRKIGLPGHPELGVGAITEDGHVCFDDSTLARLRISREHLSAVVEAERLELARRLEVYRGARSAPRLSGRDVIVVDDGVATGGTARAVLRMVRRHRPARLVLAVPVASEAAVEALRPEADHLVALTVPENFHAVGEWYRDFEQLSDDRVTAVLAELRGAGAVVRPRRPCEPCDRRKEAAGEARRKPRRPRRGGRRGATGSGLCGRQSGRRGVRAGFFESGGRSRPGSAPDGHRENRRRGHGRRRDFRPGRAVDQAALARRMRRRRSDARSSSFRPPHVPYFSGREIA